MSGFVVGAGSAMTPPTTTRQPLRLPKHWLKKDATANLTRFLHTAESLATTKKKIFNQELKLLGKQKETARYYNEKSHAN